MRAKRVIFVATVAAWLGWCGMVLSHLIRRAAEAPPATIDDYARAPSFQVLNFVVAYLPTLVLVLVGLIGVECAVFRVVERLRSGGMAS